MGPIAPRLARNWTIVLPIVARPPPADTAPVTDTVDVVRNGCTGAQGGLLQARSISQYDQAALGSSAPGMGEACRTRSLTWTHPVIALRI